MKGIKRWADFVRQVLSDNDEINTKNMTDEEVLHIMWSVVSKRENSSFNEFLEEIKNRSLPYNLN